MVLPLAGPHLSRAVAAQMGGRWRHMLSVSPRTEPRLVRTRRGELEAMPALPLDVALRCVREWAPWAVHKLRQEVEELVQSLGSAALSDAAIAAGAQAPALADDDDELL